MKNVKVVSSIFAGLLALTVVTMPCLGAQSAESLANAGNLSLSEAEDFAQQQIITPRESRDALNHELFVAAYKGDTAGVQAALADGAQINAHDTTDPNGYTALDLAAMQGHTDTVQALINAKADVDAYDNNSYTAMMYAAPEGYTDIVNALIAAHADVNAADEVGITTLMLAAGGGHADTVKALLATKKVDVNAVASENGPLADATAIIMAAMSGNVETIQALLSAGAKVTPAALNFASVAGHPEAAQVLQEAMARQAK